MPFQTKNTTNITLIFDRLIRTFFWGVKETLSPSTAMIASLFEHHTHKPNLIFCYDILKKVFITLCIDKQFLISTWFSF